jgi:hypothetical protein
MIIGGKQLKTQKDIKDYYQEKLKRIDICDSIKNEYPKDYDEFLELFKRHPNYPEKVNGIEDLKIIINPLYKCQSLIMIKCNNNEEDISYLKCVTQSSKDKLQIAMRNAITPQIYEIRDNNKLQCVICNSIDNPQVDHIIHFEKLFLDFIKGKKLPTQFDKNIGFTAVFKKQDADFEKEWFYYHKQHATFQILCRHCNCSREKYKPI